jgi:replicative DNA helicase
VMVDYVQLIRGAGKSRYENMSMVAEELKVIAKATNTILIIASQIARKEEGEIGLHDAKDSGSIENSCGLILGAWRDSEDKNRMMLKVLKNTKGQSGRIIPCRIFDSLLVSEEAKEQKNP